VADLEPWVELVPCPTVHPDLAALAARATLCRTGSYPEWGMCVPPFTLLSAESLPRSLGIITSGDTDAAGLEAGGGERERS
jgi:hypothetical protein